MEVGAQKMARFHLCFVSYNNIWDHESKPELQNVIHHIGAEQENICCTERLHLRGWDDCWTSGSKERREHSKKAKPLKADKQRPIDSTVKLFWFSQLMAGESITNPEGRRWGTSRDIYGILLHDGWKASICHSSFSTNKAKKGHNKALLKASRQAALPSGTTCQVLHSISRQMTEKGQEN